MKVMTDRIIIFDTSIFIDHLRTNKFGSNLEKVTGLIRNSAVVLAELIRGAIKKEELNFVAQMAKNHPTLSPTERNWAESGEILSRMNRERGFSPEKSRDLHFDVLIALTARNYGAILITSNETDFDMIKAYKKFKLEIW